jgi:hypothetical protein
MEQIIDKKGVLNDTINDILSILNNIDIKDNGSINDLNEKNDILNKVNLKLIDEIKEKDKIISMNNKTIHDYETQINSFNTNKEEENKFTMLKAKDKDLHEKNESIKRLEKELNQLKNKLDITSDKNIKNIKVTIEEKDETPDNTDDNINCADNVIDDSDNNNNDNSESQDSDDEVEVETIIWRKKEFYMVKEGDVQKVFEIEDEDLGKEVGLWIDNKLERHDKKKK